MIELKTNAYAQMFGKKERERGSCATVHTHTYIYIIVDDRKCRKENKRKVELFAIFSEFLIS